MNCFKPFPCKVIFPLFMVSDQSLLINTINIAIMPLSAAFSFTISSSHLISYSTAQWQ